MKWTPEPITTRPVVGRHPNGGQLVYFGTGKYLELGDNTTSGQTQTFYAIWDDNSATAPTRSQLLAQTLSNMAGPGGISVRSVSDTSITWKTGGGSGSRGWRVDLTDPGERQVSNALLREDRIIFTTLIPSTDPCKPGGTGWLMELDATNGGRVSDTFDLNDDGLFDSNDRVTVGSQTIAVSGVKSNSGAPSAPMILPGGVSPPPGTSSLTRHRRPARSGLRVRAARYGEALSEPSFERESWQTHSLEGGPDRTLSRSQPV